MIWRYDTFDEGPPAEFHGDFLLTEGLVIGGSDSPSSGFVYAFEDTSGRVRWKLPVPGGVGSRVHRHGDLVLAVSLRGAVIEASGVNELLEPTGRSSVSCVRPSASEIRWKHSSEHPWTTPSPLVWGGAVVVGHEGSLQVLDLKDGTRSWEWRLDGTPRGVGASNQFLYVGTLGGKLMVLPWK